MIAIIVLSIGIPLLINYLTIGKIIINTNSKYDITIKKLAISSSSISTVTGNGNLTANLKSGSYTVSVSNGSFSTQRVVQIKAHQTEHINLSLQSVGQVEPVSSQMVFDLMATDQSLTYIDLSNHSLTMVTDQNQEKALLPNVIISSLDWATSALGIAQNQLGQLYAVEGSIATELSLPISTSINNYSIAPNGLMYFSNGNVLYAGMVNGDYKQILKSSSNIHIVNASNSGVLVQMGVDSEGSAGDVQNNLRLITPLGKTYTGNIDIDDTAWSPNGSDLAITSDTLTAVYNNQLHLLYSLPTSNVDSIVWLNNTTILYGIAGNLWSYNTQTQTSNILANTSVFGYVSEIYPSQDGSYIYIGVQNANTNNIYLTRLGLENQPVSALMQQLQVFLPDVYEGCSLGYLAFTSPAIIVGETSTAASNCTIAAKNYLQTYGISPTGLNFEAEN